MKVKEYLENAKLFSLMGVSQLNNMADMLDSILLTEHGEKTCGSIITTRAINGIVDVPNQTVIARTVWEMNRNKWQSLIEFAESELKKPVTEVYESYHKSTTTYGKNVNAVDGGKDITEVVDKTAGFDSLTYVDKDSTKHDTTYGRTTDTTNSGSDTVITEGRNRQAERLVDYKLDFWERYGLIRTIIADTLRVISLPLYDIDL